MPNPETNITPFPGKLSHHRDITLNPTLAHSDTATLAEVPRIRVRARVTNSDHKPNCSICAINLFETNPWMASNGVDLYKGLYGRSTYVIWPYGGYSYIAAVRATGHMHAK